MEETFRSGRPWTALDHKYKQELGEEKRWTFWVGPSDTNTKTEHPAPSLCWGEANEQRYLMVLSSQEPGQIQTLSSQPNSWRCVDLTYMHTHIHSDGQIWCYLGAIQTLIHAALGVLLLNQLIGWCPMTQPSGFFSFFFFCPESAACRHNSVCMYVFLLKDTRAHHKCVLMLSDHHQQTVNAKVPSPPEGVR